MSSSAKLRVGFIGAGGNTRLRHLPGFAAINGIELAAVANRSIESAQAVAQEFGITEAKATWREIVDDPAIDAVCIGTWPDTHAEMTIAALEAGKHVLVEARMARNVAEARAMAAAAKCHPQQIAQIVPSPFTLDADAVIAQLIAKGELGELREVVSEFRSNATVDPTLPLSWRLDQAISGVNTMALGICYEPLLRWIPGDAKVIATDARIFTRNRLLGDGSAGVVEIPESLTVLGEWAGGARLVMHQSSVDHGPGYGCFRIVGSKSTLTFDVFAQQLTRIDSTGNSCVIEFEKRPNSGWMVEEQFVNSIRCGTPVSLTDFKSGVRYMEFSEAVWQAWNA